MAPGIEQVLCVLLKGDECDGLGWSLIPCQCLWNVTTVAEWEEPNSSREEIQSVSTCSSFITKYDGQKIRYFLYRRLKQNEEVKSQKEHSTLGAFQVASGGES